MFFAVIFEIIGGACVGFLNLLQTVIVILTILSLVVKPNFSRVCAQNLIKVLQNSSKDDKILK